MRIRIKDKRRGVFTVDNVVLNHYGKAMGATGIALYVTLCRFADNQTQKCYPSIRKIKEETGIDFKTVIETAERLEKLKLITKEVTVGKYTIYTLLEPIDDGIDKDDILKKYYELYNRHQGDGKSITPTRLMEKAHRSDGKNPHGDGKSTYKRTKINELNKRTKNLSSKEPKTSNEVKEILSFFKETYHIKSIPNPMQNLGAAKWLFNEKGLEKTLASIQAAFQCRGQEFAPSISNLLDLRSKYGKLEEYYFRQRNRKPRIGILDDETERFISS